MRNSSNIMKETTISHLRDSSKIMKKIHNTTLAEQF
jgi:hypothetical protein